MKSLTSQFVRLIFSPSWLATVLTGCVVFSLSMQKYFLERYSVLERIGLGIALLLLIVVVSGKVVTRFYLALPFAALAAVMGLSLSQLHSAPILSDYIGYLLIGAYAVVLVSAFGVRSAVNGSVVALSILLFVSLVIATQNPSVLLGRSPLLGTFYGPNTLAASVIVLLPAALAAEVASKAWTYSLRLLLVFASFGVVLLTRATTELFSFGALLVAWAGFVYLPRMSRPMRTGVWVAFSSMMILVVAYWPAILEARGKSNDLSGRGGIWAAYFDKILERPVFGYGWSIQTTPEMPLGALISVVIGPHIHNAHSDFINWWAHTGIFGAALYLFLLLSLFWLGIRLRKKNRAIALWAVVTALTLGVNGVAEMTTFFPDGWAVLALVSTTMSVVAARSSADGNLRHNLGYRGFSVSKS